eukprot:8775783-Alexandrium_andersonii.AAC.1
MPRRRNWDWRPSAPQDRSWQWGSNGKDGAPRKTRPKPPSWAQLAKTQARVDSYIAADQQEG